MSKEVFIIIPCYNRKRYTFECLSNLTTIRAIDRFNVVIVDDGSSDGTSEMVGKIFPQVTLLQGDGSLFWTGAIELGMRYAMKHQADCVVWLNDDSLVSSGSIERLVKVAKDSRGIASALGYVNMHTIGKKWYFPIQKKGTWGLVSMDSKPATGLLNTDSCRGNFVAIDQSVIQKIGYPDGIKIPHICGDSDYSLRATTDGISCVVVTDVLLEELDTTHSNNESWLLGSENSYNLWKRILSKKSSYYPPMRWLYLKRHWGYRGVIAFPIPYLKLFVITFLRIIFSKNVLISFYGNKSHAWLAKSWSRNANS